MKKGKWILGVGLLAAGAAQATIIHDGSTLFAAGGTIDTEYVFDAADRWQMENVTITVTNNGAVTISDTENINVGSSKNSTLIIDGGNFSATTTAAFLLGNGSTGVGVVSVLSGSFSVDVGTSLFIGRDRASGLLSISGGTVTLYDMPTFDAPTTTAGTEGDGSIDFTTDSVGALTIAGANLSYYQGLYSEGNLTYNGVNTEPFADVFTVNGSTLTVPEPATLGMVVACGGAILFIRRRYMM